MRDLDNIRVIYADELDDTELLLKGFQVVWYEYGGRPLAVRKPFLPLCISQGETIRMLLEDRTHIAGVGLGWQ